MTQEDAARAAEEREATREALKERLVPEVDTALKADEDIRAWPGDGMWRSKGEIKYFYRSSRLLTRDADLPRVTRVLQELGALGDPPEPQELQSRNLIDGITRVATRVPASKHTPDVVEDLDKRLGLGVATLDHAFVVTSYVTVCPATEPDMAITSQDAADPQKVREAVWPPEGDPAAGRDVRVSVVDTGLLDGAARWAPWLRGVEPNTQRDVDNPDELRADGQGRARDGFADPYAGHGTFVSGVLRCVAPATDVRVEKILGVSGFVRESRLVTQIHDALTRAPDILTMSAGGTTRCNIPPLSLQTLYEKRLRQLGGVLLVAAAGNDGQPAPFWPAAFPWCVGVGSMSRDGQRRSPFSNYGSWVDVYAPGEDIVNAYAQLKYKTIKDAAERDTSAGIVKWSGTSFSTPIVTGLIAARMSRTGENAQEAAAALLAAARAQFRPGVGPRLFP